jgi:hypothetical protein
LSYYVLSPGWLLQLNVSLAGCVLSFHTIQGAVASVLQGVEAFSPMRK